MVSNRNPACRSEVIAKATPVSEAVTELGESPLWDSAVGVRWLDISGQRMFTLDLEGRETAISLSAAATAVELSATENLFAVTRTGFGWLDPDSGRIEQALTVITDDGITMNDGAIDACGRCWAGSVVQDDSWRGTLYRVDCGGVTAHIRQLGMSNGIDWSPTGEVLYHVDSSAGTLTAWQYDQASGDLGSGKVLLTVPDEVGLPDGLTVDADGHIWLAIWGPGRVWRIEPDTGDITGVVEVPTAYTTSCAFGGYDLCTLYITTANYQQPSGGGLLYAVDVPANGRQPHRFVGALP